MVVDDEESLREVLVQLFAEDGYVVDLLPTAEDALEVLMAKHHDLVITDIKLPGMSGIDLMKEVRAFNRTVQFIVIASHASLDTAVAAIRSGAYDYITRPFDDIQVISNVVNRTMEKIRLSEENRKLVNDLRKKHDALAKANKILKDLTIRDALTGLYNHGYFQEALSNEIVRAIRHKRRFTLLFIDLDYFRIYNDNSGHPQGDSLLVTLSNIFQNRLRQSDIIARYGGEEFVIILTETPKEKGMKVAESIWLEVLKQTFPGAEKQPLGKVTISTGVAGYPEDGKDAPTLLKSAEAALYLAKKNGRNRVEVV